MNDEAIEVVLAAAKRVREINKTVKSPLLTDLTVNLYTDVLDYIESTEQITGEEFAELIECDCDCDCCGCDEVDIIGELIENVARLNETVDDLTNKVRRMGNTTNITIDLNKKNIVDLIIPKYATTSPPSPAIPQQVWYTYL